MAVDHYPEKTLTVHRFSRAGDRWKYMLPRLRRKPIASVVFDVLGTGLVWQHGAYRVALSCPYCGTSTLTADDTYCVQFLGGGVNHYSAASDRPQGVQCLACQRAVDATDLLQDWRAKDLDALVTVGPLRRYCPTPQTFIVDQPEDGQFWIGRTVDDALRGNVGPVFPLIRRLSRIEAMDQEHAMSLVETHHASMPWRDVAITGELEPEDLAWHGGPLAHWEQHKVRRRRWAEATKKRKGLDAEVEAFRRLREAELLRG